MGVRNLIFSYEYKETIIDRTSTPKEIISTSNLPLELSSISCEYKEITSTSDSHLKLSYLMNIKRLLLIEPRLDLDSPLKLSYLANIKRLLLIKPPLRTHL